MRRRSRIRLGGFGSEPERSRPDALDDEPLTKAQIRELRRRVGDLDDPVRYVLVSELTPRFALYYDVSDDVYAMNEPKGGTLFKRRQTALAVKRSLRSGVRRRGSPRAVQVVRRRG
ncbi:MAG: hypothetical protein ACE5JD_05195 [Candidatus Methylomirabilia bacterium]